MEWGLNGHFTTAILKIMEKPLKLQRNYFDFKYSYHIREKPQIPELFIK